MSHKRETAHSTIGLATSGKAPEWTRKNMEMDSWKLEEARRILGARTDTETVDKALDLVIFRKDVFSALDRLVEAGGIDDIH